MNSNIHQKGFTLIETLVGTAVFVLVALSAYKAFGVLMDTVSASRAKIIATSLANEKFEIIRNLPYDDVGIVNGLPAGKINRTQNAVSNGQSFIIQTTIRNIDDPFDGTIGGNPSDSSPADYKLADLDITCSNCKIFSPLKFVTLVAPHSLETASTNGALFIRVFDSAGLPIQGASVHIENTQTNPDTIIDETTDNDGWIKIIDAPPGINAYSISATKSGFSEDRTYPIGGIAGEDPILPDITVVVQQVTQTSFLIDKTSSLSVETIDSICAPLPNVNLSLTGTKIIGLPSVLKYGTQNFTTNSAGNLTIENLESDDYKMSLTGEIYDLAGINLFSFPIFTVNSDENITAQMLLVPHVDKALLISVKDSLESPIDGATVQLQKVGFDETKNTNAGPCGTPGQTFWNGLSSGTYTLTVSKTGYQSSVNFIDISGSWQSQNIILNP